MRAFVPLLLCSLASTAVAATKEFKAGHVFVASRLGQLVCEFKPDGTYVKTHAPGSADVFDLDFGADGLLYVPKQTDVESTARIRAFRADGVVVRDLPVTGTPVAVRTGPGGRVYVAEFDQNRIDVIGASNSVEAAYTAFLPGPLGLAFTPRGTLAVACETSSAIVFLDPLGAFTKVIGVPAPKRVTMLGDGSLYASNQAGTLAFHDRYGNPYPNEDIAEPMGAPIFDVAMQADATPILVLPSANVALDVDSTLVPFAAAALVQPSGVVIAPYRFKAKIAGTLTQLGGKAKSVKQTAVLSVLPGSNRVMLSFAPKSKLGKAFLGQAFVCHGVEDGGAFLPGHRAMHASQRVDASLVLADVSIALSVVEKTPPTIGEFAGVKSAQGSLHASTSFATFVGSIKTSKLLN